MGILHVWVCPVQYKYGVMYSYCTAYRQTVFTVVLNDLQEDQGKTV